MSSTVRRSGIHVAWLSQMPVILRDVNGYGITSHYLAPLPSLGKRGFLFGKYFGSRNCIIRAFVGFADSFI